MFTCICIYMIYKSLTTRIISLIHDSSGSGPEGHNVARVSYVTYTNEVHMLCRVVRCQCKLTNILEANLFNFFHELESNFQIFSLLNVKSRLGIVSRVSQGERGEREREISMSG